MEPADSCPRCKAILTTEPPDLGKNGWWLGRRLKAVTTRGIAEYNREREEPSFQSAIETKYCPQCNRCWDHLSSADKASTVHYYGLDSPVFSMDNEEQCFNCGKDWTGTPITKWRGLPELDWLKSEKKRIEIATSRVCEIRFMTKRKYRGHTDKRCALFYK